MVCIGNFPLGPQPVALPGEVVEPLGRGASLEKVGHWEQALKFSGPAQTLFAATTVKCDQLPLPPTFSAVVVCDSSNCEPKVNLSFLSRFVGCFLIARGKETNTSYFLALHPRSDPEARIQGCSLWENIS